MSKLKRKQYEKLLEPMQEELVAMARWVAATGQRVVVLFEGRDTAGKGGAIQAIAARLNPRQCRTVALPKPTEAEAGQWYFQRYAAHLPTTGQIILFDRSWYNRAGVERVMGFCTKNQAKSFLREVPAVEKAMVESGIILLKYWLEVSPEEQTSRLAERIDDKRKIWKLSQMDLDSYTRWDDYTRCRDDMFEATDTSWAPWFIARSDNKRQTRLNIISHLLLNIPYKNVPRGEVKLPKRNLARSKPLRDSLRIVPEADI